MIQDIRYVAIKGHYPFVDFGGLVNLLHHSWQWHCGHIVNHRGVSSCQFQACWFLQKGPLTPQTVIGGSQDRSVIWSYHSHSAFLKSNFFLHLFKHIYWRCANKWCIFNTFEEYFTVTLCSARFSDLYPMLHFRNRTFSLCCSNFLQPAVWGVTPNAEGVLMRITICASVEGANAQWPQWLPLKILFSDCVLFESRDKGGSTSLWHLCFKMWNWCLSFSPVDMQWRCTMILHHNCTVL